MYMETLSTRNSESKVVAVAMKVFGACQLAHISDTETGFVWGSFFFVGVC